MSARRLVRVGLADSGVNPRHAQVGKVAGGVGIRFSEGEVTLDDEWQDLLGHGTAAAATIHGHCSDALLYSIRIFRRRLLAPAETLLAAIRWAAAEELDVLNLSLGCTNLERKGAFEEAVAIPTTILSAQEANGEPSLPGCLEGVVGVKADESLEDDRLRFEDGVFYASPWARPLGPLPKERNFHGVSLAVAHVTGMVAQLLSDGIPKSEIVDALKSRSVA